MSASLVGSEMCIRDSLLAVPRASARAPGAHRSARSAGDAVRRGVPADAVSYTHLTLPTICSV
eukprot:8725286-Alexandrium_andersonii.AAC.1